MTVSDPNARALGRIISMLHDEANEMISVADFTSFVETTTQDHIVRLAAFGVFMQLHYERLRKSGKIELNEAIDALKICFAPRKRKRT